MPVLQSIEGKLYDVPDHEAGSFEIPREEVAGALDRAGFGPRRAGSDGPRGMPGPSPMVVRIFTDGMPGPRTGRPMPAAPPAEREDDVVRFYGWNWPNHWKPWGWNNKWTDW